MSRNLLSDAFFSENMRIVETPKQIRNTETASMTVRFWRMRSFSRMQTLPTVPARGIRQHSMSVPSSLSKPPKATPRTVRTSSLPVQTAASPTPSGTLTVNKSAPERMNPLKKCMKSVKMREPFCNSLSAKSAECSADNFSIA